MSSIARLILLCLLLSTAAANAADVHVPKELADWQDWVLQGKDYRQCPFYFDRKPAGQNDYVCAWPETLEIAVDRNGARFSQRWEVSADESWLPLPGDPTYWPDQVTLNGAAAAVVERNGTPSVRVLPGRYRLIGRFLWDERPGALRVPPQSGLVSLVVDGNRIANPELARGSVFLGERQREAESRDAVTVHVYRLVADDVPTRLVTRLQVDVAGRVREELFGPVLPDDFVPLSLQSELPARLEADGRLRVQVRPGRWEMTLSSRAPTTLNSVMLAGTENNLPEDEIWSYRSNDRLRVTAAEGLTPVDPAQVQAPAEWSRLPAFRIEKGGALTIQERSRGLVSADNDLGLRRQMWLDFNGSGFVVRDALTGTMRTGWRLDMRPPFRLESATARDENLLITKGELPGSTGIELREPEMDALTLGRSESTGEMPVSGWDASFSSVDTQLFLPPGHKLLMAAGVDSAAGSWAGQWQLLDFFMVLIITVAAWKLLGRTAGVVALLALTLSYNEVNAPAWLWLNLLISIALIRVAPQGRLKVTVQAYLGVSALLLFVALVPFVASQLRIAIYPQLEPQWNLQQYDSGIMSEMMPEEADFGMDAPRRAGEAMLQKTAPMSDRVQALEEITVTGSKVSTANFARYAPTAIVQAGSGIPSWQWNAYRLNFSGPVDADQTLRLVILPRWFVTMLRVLEVLLLLLFAAIIAAEVVQRRWTLPGGLTLGRAANAVLLVGLVGLLPFAGTKALAQTPDPGILAELENRLLEASDCVPRCAEIAAADVEVDGDTVNVRLTINAIEEVAIPLPGSPKGFRPDVVLVEGSASAPVFRGADQRLWLRVPSGIHGVVVRGSAAGVDSLEIAFPTPPRVVQARADGWLVAGIKDRRLLSGSLQLTRLQTGSDGDRAPRWESSRFPAFVHVQRSIELGLDWRVTTTVQRISPDNGGLTLELPLIAGESVVSADMTVADGRILVSMSPAERAVSWQSNLPRSSPLVLQSEAGAAWAETWYVGVGSVWHAEFRGVPESETGFRGAGVRMAEFHPRGGESLEIVANRPEAAEGSTLAFDAVKLSVEQGARSQTTRLDLEYRSTRGAQHLIRLPADAEITNVVIDGRTEPLQAERGELTLPILPGKHDIGIEWRELGEVGWLASTPEIDLGAAASNLSLALSMPENRWILGTRGPRLGPAVLYWSELAVLVLLAVIFGRIAWTPLRTYDWLLLGLGFSTFNWPVLGLVALWIVAVGARDKWRGDGPWWRYNLLQVVVIFLTVVALASIVLSLPTGLLGRPDMHIAGNGSSAGWLLWFADRSASLTPAAQAVSAPLWAYKVLILAWALWLSFALLRWLPWAWQCFARDGFFQARNRPGDERSNAG